MATRLETTSDVREFHDPVADGMKRDGLLSLRASPPLVELLDGLSRRLGVPVTEVLAEAVFMLKVAVEAEDRGQRICLADRDLKIVGELVDLIASGGVGIDPFPEADSDRPDR